MITEALNVGLVVLSVPALGWTTYLGTLALLSRRVVVPEGPPPRLKFDVLVPAHDEEDGIGATVESLLAVDYPAEMRRVVVIADNCADATARRAAEAGAVVVERVDADRKGKGYALAHGFQHSIAEGFADAVVVVDADTVVTPNLLTAFAARFERGADAIQAEYGVANADASWRTRLMHLAFTLFHDVRSRARERLGVSAGLRGNGMAFRKSVLREVPHDAFTLVEDVEYGIKLGLAGRRVWYAGEARVLGQMVSSERASRSQRRRWEGGRRKLARDHLPALLRRGLRERNLLLLDLAADVLVPPLTYVAVAVLAGAFASSLWATLGHQSPWLVLPWGLALVGLAVYLARGAWLARVGPRIVLDLAWAPVYMLWKIMLAVRASPSSEREWVRTAREEGRR